MQALLTLERSSDAAEQERQTGALIQEYGRFPEDTGSPEVQIAILTTRINQLTEHLKSHKQDDHTPGAACSRWSASAAAT
jgi:hypothetical protein